MTRRFCAACGILMVLAIAGCGMGKTVAAKQEVIGMGDEDREETLSKNQLRQLQSLHGDLDTAKGRLEAYFKKPP